MRGPRRADRSSRIALHEIDAHRTLGIPDDRIDVVHLGVDAQASGQPRCRQPFVRATTCRTIVRTSSSSSRKDPRKNVSLLSKAFARVRQEIPGVTLLKVGAPAFDDQRRANLRHCSDLGIADAVRFFDDVAEDELPLLLPLASVLAFPSLYEGFGFPVLEALACGTPVVAANASSIPELVGDAARLVNGTSVERLRGQPCRHVRDGPGDVQARVARACQLHLVANGRAHAGGVFFCQRCIRSACMDVNLVVPELGKQFRCPGLPADRRPEMPYAPAGPRQ